MKYLSLLLILLLSACSLKNYTQTQTKIITMKTKALKFSDLAYIRSSGDAIEIELFTVGESVFKASIEYLICTQDGCMSKSAFNERYLSSAYPDSLLQNILLGRPIYGAKNSEAIEGGFEQKIVSEDVDISYRVTPREIYFRDIKNKILFKIKESK